MRRTVRSIIALPALAALAACSTGRPTTETFVWKGPVTPGQWLHLRNVNGDFAVRQGTGDSAEITFEITRSNRMAPTAQVKVLKASDGVIACVLFSDNGRCATDDYRAGSSSRSGFPMFGRGRTSVEGTIVLPRSVKLDVATTNGDIEVTGASGDVVTATTNGDMTARGLRGAVRATSTNGDIDLGIDALGGAVTVETTNGEITATLPASLNAVLNMATTNGELDLGLAGNITTKTRRLIAATLGTGGTPISFTTTNGGITVH